MIRLAVRVPAVHAERVLGAMSELAPDGFEQIDGEDFVEFAVYGAPGELPELAEGEAEIAGVTVMVTGLEVPDDWAERWKRFHVPVLLGGVLYVRPPWAEPPVRPGVHDVVIDPGRAFGTGTHPTTRLALELMLEVRGELGPRRSLADVVVANLSRSLLLELGPVLAESSSELILSGLLDSEADLVRAAFGRVERRRLSLDGWSALRLGPQ